MAKRHSTRQSFYVVIIDEDVPAPTTSASNFAGIEFRSSLRGVNHTIRVRSRSFALSRTKAKDLNRSGLSSSAFVSSR